MIKRAKLSACGTYRYWLSRRWSDYGDSLVFVMLNPSTADAEVDDPTIRRCVSFAKREGYAEIIVVNVFAYRATDPKDLLKAKDPIGIGNTLYIDELARDRDVLCAWGASVPARLHAAVDSVVKILRLRASRMLCLGKTKSGAPRHPLYVRGDQPTEEY